MRRGGGDAGAPASGGGGGAQAPAALSGTITSVSNAPIDLNASGGETTVAWSSTATAASQVAVRVNGAVVSTQPASPAGGLKVAVPFGEIRAELVNQSGTVLDTKTAMALCGFGHWDTAKCARYTYEPINLVRYFPIGDLTSTDEKAYMPLLVLKSKTLTPLKNRTGYERGPGAAFPIAGCAIYTKSRLEDGAPCVSCTTVGAGNLRRTFPVNPHTNELLPEQTCTMPADAELVSAAEVPDIKYGQYGVGKHTYLEAPEGIYYIPGDAPASGLRLTTDLFKTYEVIDGSTQYFVIVSVGPP